MTPKIIELPKILDKRENLSFFEYPNQLPFEITKTYWIYDVPGGEVRGSHAFNEQQEFTIALSGSIDIVSMTERRKNIFFKQIILGLYIPKMYWRKLLYKFFSANCIRSIV